MKRTILVPDAMVMAILTELLLTVNQQVIFGMPAQSLLLLNATGTRRDGGVWAVELTVTDQFTRVTPDQYKLADWSAIEGSLPLQ